MRQPQTTATRVAEPSPRISGQVANRLRTGDRTGHEWYRFVLSFPPHLVRDCLEKFAIVAGQRVLDPFCGTGTTLVECKKAGLASVGLEANPMAHFASTVKTTWDKQGGELLTSARRIADAASRELEAQGYGDDSYGPLFDGAKSCAGRAKAPLQSLDDQQTSLLLGSSISPLPLHKTLVLLGEINRSAPPRLASYCHLALARALVESVGNLHFGPEVGVGAPKADVGVVREWFNRLADIARDLDELRPRRDISCRVLRADARNVAHELPPESIDAVITSPPYPNEKDYTRTTRLESVILGFIKNKAELREFKRTLVRSNTRNVYRDDNDHGWVELHPEIQRLAARIEQRRIELNKTSGFERMYARVTRLYFGGMARHLAGLRSVLRPGARLAYVVGDQASYLRVLIKTGEILARIAESLGYRVTGIDLFRTRLATATRAQLREEVLLLQWPGAGKSLGQARERRSQILRLTRNAPQTSECCFSLPAQVQPQTTFSVCR